MRKICRNGYWIRIFCVMLILVAGTPLNGSSSSQTHPPQENSTKDAVDTEQIPEDQNSGQSGMRRILGSFWHDVWTLPEVIVEETKEVVAIEDNAMLLLLVGGASITLHNTTADREIADNFNLHHILGEEADKIVDLLGGPGFHFAATGLWYAMSVDDNDDFNKQRSWTMMKALSVTGALTLGLKIIRNNDTPNGNILAWPSGHTSSSFTVASVLDEFYGPEVGIPAYLAAGFVGYRMMDSGDHWASDVLFGGVLGYIVGHHIARKHMDLEVAGFKVIPFTDIASDRSAMGVSLVKQF